MPYDLAAFRERLASYEARKAQEVREDAERKRQKLPPLRWKDQRDRTYDRFARQIWDDLTAHPLRRLRVAEGLTLAELSAKSKVSARTISAIERREWEPKPQTLRRLATALGVDPEAISE